VGGTAGFPFDGLIDEVSLYSRGLSQAEIQAIYAAGSAGKCAAVVPPAISTQPTDQTVSVGGSATFRVGASGTAPLSYQWRFNGGALLGQTGTSLLLTNVQLDQAGNYSVVVTNQAGTAVSSNAVLTVLGPTTNCVPPPPGLVSWWQGEGNGADAVGGNNGALFPGTTFGSGEVGQAFSFDGENSAVVVPAATNLAVESITIEGWIVITDTVLARPIVEFANPTGPCAMNMWYNIKPGVQGNSAGLYGFFRDDGGHAVDLGTAPGVLHSNQWNHVVLTFQANSSNDVLALYVNGVNVGVTTSTVPVLWQSFENLNLGYRPVGSSDLWGGRRHLGLLDEISIYDRALPAAEIQAIYNAGSAGKCLAPPPPTCLPAPTNLISWWRGEGNAVDSWDHNKGDLHDVTFAAGEVGHAFSFNGTSDYVHIPVAGNLPAASNLNVGVGLGLTLDAWVSPSDIGNGHPIIEWSRPVGGAPYGVHLWVGHPSHPPGYFYANIADTDGNWHVIDSDPCVLQGNVFQHLAVTYNKTTGLGRLFLNGTIVKEINWGIFTPQTSYELYFGERPPGDINSRFYAGLIDEIDVFSRALEPAEIQAIYDAGTVGKCVVNRPPVANDFREQTLMRQPVTIPDVTFIAACSDPDEDFLTLDSVSNTSTNGGVVVLNAGVVTYTPPAGFIGADSFTYTIGDGSGATASAFVLMQVNPSPFAAHMLTPAFVDGGFQFSFLGYPGATYTLQRAESLAGPWVDLGSVTVDANGNGTLLDSNPPQGNAFYRAVYH
jgi:hypothetical protein